MANKNYVRKIVSNYCVLDLETTGLSPYYDEVIEIGVLRIREDEIVERYSQLIKPECGIDYYITELTGIDNKMVEGMPSLCEVKDEVIKFLGNDIIIGHRTAFDLNFLKYGFEVEFNNLYIDTYEFARKLFPELKHHRLNDLTKYLNLSNNEHRALADCISTKELYDAIKQKMIDNNLVISDLWFRRQSRSKGKNIHSIVPETIEIDEDSYFYNKHVVFTGKLEKMLRQDAMQIVVNLGGILDKNVIKSTNYLILGDNSYNAILRGEKSSKRKKAEKMKLEGYDIEIIDEKTFYDLLEL